MNLVKHGEGMVTLKREGNRFCIIHGASAEVVWLDPTMQHVRLHLSESGYSYLSSGSCSIWCDNLFEVGVYTHDGQYWFQLLGAPQPLRGDVYACEGQLQTDMVVDDPPGELTFRCARYAKPRAGLHLWWDLAAWYRLASLTAFSSYGRWAAHGWPRWKEWLNATMCLGEQHAISCVGNKPRERTHNSLDFRAVSSQALSALVARWCFASRNRGGLVKDKDRESLLRIWKCVVAKALVGTHHSANVYVCSQPSLDEFGFGVGSRMCVVTLDNLSLDIRGLLAESSALRKHLGSADSQYGFWDFLERSPLLKRRMFVVRFQVMQACHVVAPVSCQH